MYKALAGGLEVRELQRRRREVAAEAWSKGHVVTVKELEALADLPRTSEYGLTAEQKEELRQAHDEIRNLFAK